MSDKNTSKYLEHKTCILCGEDIHERTTVIDRLCDFCGQTKAVSVECENSHCICQDCIALSSIDYITAMCLKYKGIDPIELAVDIMNSPSINMHGAEHHYIVPAVLTVCLHNHSNSDEPLKDKLKIIENRAMSETPDKCSYDLGTCGAALGTGVFLSSYLKRELKDEDEWSLTNTIISESLKTVVDSGGPRCCKRDTYLSLQTAISFLKDRFAIELPLSQAKCTFSLRNRTCKHEDCQFYNISNSLV